MSSITELLNPKPGNELTSALMAHGPSGSDQAGLPSPTLESEAESRHSELPSQLSSAPSTQFTAQDLYIPSEGDCLIERDCSIEGPQSESPTAVDEDGRSSYRKRNSLPSDLSEATIDGAQSAAMPTPSPERQDRAVIGWWRGSPVQNPKKRHAAAAFIDARGRLRRQIQKEDVYGERIEDETLLPSGSGSRCLTLENVDHFNGLDDLDHSEMKEFVLLRAGVEPEGTDEERDKNIQTAIQAAIRKARETTPTKPLLIAKGATPGEATVSSESKKRRRTHSRFDDTKSTPPPEKTASSVDIIIHDGVTYKRAKTGSLADNLVSPAELITADGENYVIYHVLTKSLLI